MEKIIESVLLTSPIVWIMYLIGVAALFIFLRKSLQFYREKENVEELITGLINTLRLDRIVEAFDLCDSTPGPVARVLAVSITAYQNGEDICKAMETQSKEEVKRLEGQSLKFLSIFAFIAPILGFLGTVIFLLNDFLPNKETPPLDTISKHVYGSLSCIAAGSILAIFCCMAFVFLWYRIKSFCLDMEKASFSIFLFYQKKTKTCAERTMKIRLRPNIELYKNLSSFIFHIIPLCSFILTLFVFFWATQRVMPIQGFAIGGRPVSLPKSDSAQKFNVERPLIVTVDDHGRFYFKDKMVNDIESLASTINEERRKRMYDEKDLSDEKEEELVVRFDERVKIDILAKLKDIAAHQKIKLTIVVDPEESKKDKTDFN